MPLTPRSGKLKELAETRRREFEDKKK